MNRKKRICLLITFCMILAMSVTAFAEDHSNADPSALNEGETTETQQAEAQQVAEDKPYSGPLPLYANSETVNVYKNQDKDSKVISKLKGAQSVVPEMVSKNDKWIGILVEDTQNGGQRIGWVQAEQLVDYVPQNLCEHDWDQWRTEREATCTQTGYRWRICSICGLEEEQETAKLDHEWSEWKVAKEATCTVAGTRERTCSICKETQKEEYLKEHTYGAWEMTKAPTCTAAGERQRTCKVCGKVDRQTLDKVPHDYEYKIITEATDHSAGVRAKVCKVCGSAAENENFDPEGTLRRGNQGEAVAHMQQLLVDQGYLNTGGADGIFGGGTEKALMKYQQDRKLNPDGIGWPQTLKDLEHDFDPWKVVKEMTRTEAGERVRVCKGCGFEQHESIEIEIFEFNRRGEDVRALQQMLTELGYDAGSYDGIYGKMLDSALAGFADANGIVVEAGKVRPSDVDAVMNAWFEIQKPEQWKGESSVDSPVNLALTVTPAGEADESGIRDYSWSLTNLGSEPANYLALLLTFGEDPDFKQENLVMNLDGVLLKPNAGNSVSGSFSADADWGEGSLNFAALAVTENDGGKWLSNSVIFENEADHDNKAVVPMNNEADVNHLPDGTYPVAFDKGDVLGGASGIFMNAVTIYTRDLYDTADVTALKAGDTIVVSGEPVLVESVEENEYGYLVNEEQNENSFYLSEEKDSNGYAVHGMDDMSTYTEQGVTTLTVETAATFTDSWDIESEPVAVNGKDIVTAIQTSANEYFVPHNTTVRVENGLVVEINRVYVP